MSSVPRAVLAAVAAIFVSAYTPTAAAQAPAKVADGVLTNAAGMTLYTFDRDAGGRSACNGACPANGGQLAADADAKASGDWTIITREDGARQWAYKGKPLYLWSKDAKVGDRTGDNVNNVWHVARP
jgi:predicted lipoprotein with Yx(FWY)xxD motif